MDVKISQNTNDIIQKYVNGVFRDATLEFYGLDTPKIKELINVELPVVEVRDTQTDMIFLLEDNSYLHFEFQTDFSKEDLIRFAHYDLRLFTRDGRNVTTVVIYPASVQTADTNLTVGSLQYRPGKIMMKKYNGNTIFMELEAKIKNGEPLTDVDMMNLIFLPLMKNDLPKEELAVKSIELAQTIEDKSKRNACIAAVFAFGSKYLDENQLESLKEVLSVTDLAVMFLQEGEQNNKLEVAKEMLKENETIAKIMKYTKLDESSVKKLQKELMS